MLVIEIPLLTPNLYLPAEHPLLSYPSYRTRQYPPPAPSTTAFYNIPKLLLSWAPADGDQLRSGLLLPGAYRASPPQHKAWVQPGPQCSTINTVYWEGVTSSLARSSSSSPCIHVLLNSAGTAPAPSPRLLLLMLSHPRSHGTAGKGVFLSASPLSHTKDLLPAPC